MTDVSGDSIDTREQVDALEAQIRAVTRSAREVAHRLSNDLTLAVGYVELLQVHPSLPEELRELVRGAADGLETATHNVERLHRDLRTASETSPRARRACALVLRHSCTVLCGQQPTQEKSPLMIY